MHAAGDRVAAPDQDQPALGEELQVHADLAAVGGGQRLAAGAGADGAVQQAGTQLVEEARRHAFALHQPHGAGVAVRQDRLRVAPGDRPQPCRDVVQRLVPAHRLEVPAALGAAALQRRQHTLRVVGALGITADLGAQRAVRRGVGRVALDADHAACLHRDVQGAGVRAVVRTGGAHAAREVRWHREMRTRRRQDRGIVCHGKDYRTAAAAASAAGRRGTQARRAGAWFNAGAMRLLILEDDADLGEALATGLRQSGHVVDWFRDGAQADAALDGTPYDAMLLDLGLPGTDGMTWLRALAPPRHGAAGADPDRPRRRRAAHRRPGRRRRRLPRSSRSPSTSSRPGCARCCAARPAVRSRCGRTAHCSTTRPPSRSTGSSGRSN